MNGTNTEPVPADKESSMGYLESYTYSCMEGYKTNDTLCTVCLPDGSLSSPAPNCGRKLLDQGLSSFVSSKLIYSVNTRDANLRQHWILLLIN